MDWFLYLILVVEVVEIVEVEVEMKVVDMEGVNGIIVSIYWWVSQSHDLVYCVIFERDTTTGCRESRRRRRRESRGRWRATLGGSGKWVMAVRVGSAVAVGWR